MVSQMSVARTSENAFSQRCSVKNERNDMAQDGVCVFTAAVPGCFPDSACGAGCGLEDGTWARSHSRTVRGRSGLTSTELRKARRSSGDTPRTNVPLYA